MTDSQQAPFAGAKALIFGGAKGIGKAVALEWARRGAHAAGADPAEDAAREPAPPCAGCGTSCRSSSRMAGAMSS